VFSSTSGSVSKKRSATRSINTKRRSGDMKQRCAGRNKKSICESKSVHIGGVPSSDTVGMRVLTQNNCPKCSDKYTEYRQDIAIR
jgi:hypothetical protein